MLHTEVLPDHSLELLKIISPILTKEGFYLAGGTALALQRGHRISVDLDFFSEDAFDPNALARLLGKVTASSPTIIQQTSGSLCMALADTKVELLHYPYPHIIPPTTIAGILLASLADITAMKLSAATNRGSKKDFIDIATLLDSFSLHEMLSFHQIKFPSTDIFTVIKSLTYFDDAEQEPQPRLLDHQTWENVKIRLLQAVAD